MLGVALAAWMVIAGIRAAHLLDFVHRQRLLALVVLVTLVGNAVDLIAALSGN